MKVLQSATKIVLMASMLTLSIVTVLVIVMNVNNEAVIEKVLSVFSWAISIILPFYYLQKKNDREDKQTTQWEIN